MKIQYIAVIFIVIIMPIAMVMQSYILSQMDTIELQVKYNTSLTNATHDAIKAFQINTVNNRYSSISNSKIRDIEAAINTFYNSLTNSENLSKEDLQAYTPALVFTLYDGYYIYSKYDNVYPENNGKPETSDINNAQDNWGLKPYIYYSCRYRNNNKDFVVNYTLDNAITLYGYFDSVNGYQTLSGYLINPDAVTIDASYNADEPSTWILTYGNTINGVEIGPEILTEHLLFNNEEEGDYEYLEYNGQKIYYDKGNDPEENSGLTQYFRYQDYQKTYITESYANNSLTEYLRDRTWDNHLHSTSSFEYYHDAKEFSEKVATLTDGITQAHAIDEQGNPIDFHMDTEGEILVPSDDNDPLISGSNFNENRVAVIRKSIETNLTAAIANYNSYSGTTFEFALPVLDETDWEKVTNNVSMITFLQGIPIGHKIYNNYCVITNDSNEEVIKKDNIYIVTENASGQREYHLPGCHELMENEDLTIVEAYSNLSFIRQTVRISEGNYWYFYPQMRKNGNNITTITGCYHCIVSSASLYPIDDIISGTVYRKNDNWEDEVEYTARQGLQQNRFGKIQQLYLMALGRERHDLYQANIDAFTM